MAIRSDEGRRFKLLFQGDVLIEKEISSWKALQGDDKPLYHKSCSLIGKAST